MGAGIMWRDWTNWARVGIWAAAVVLFFLIMGGIAGSISGPIQAATDYVGRVGGPIGQGLVGLAIIGGLFALSRLVNRRDERRQIAETGILDAPPPVDHRRNFRRYALATSPLWLAVAALFVIAVASNFTTWRPW